MSQCYGKCETSNKKYTDPYIKNTNKVLIYSLEDNMLNSPEYLNYNYNTYTKSYNNIEKSYKHFVTKIIEKI